MSGVGQHRHVRDGEQDGRRPGCFDGVQHGVVIGLKHRQGSDQRRVARVTAAGERPEHVVVADPDRHEGRLGVLHGLDLGATAQDEGRQRIAVGERAEIVGRRERGGARHCDVADVEEPLVGPEVAGARRAAADAGAGDVVGERRGATPSPGAKARKNGALA